MLLLLAVLPVNTRGCLSSDIRRRVGSWLEIARVAKEETDWFNPNPEGIWSPFCGEVCSRIALGLGKLALMLLVNTQELHSVCLELCEPFLSGIQPNSKSVAGQNVLRRAGMFGEDWLVAWESVSPITKELNFFNLDILEKNNLAHLVEKYSYGLLLGITVFNIVYTF